jgi:hypothetical protein
MKCRGHRRIAFIGDQGNDDSARVVLELIKAEGAHAIMHQGDFEYERRPATWDSVITSVLGTDYPYFGTIGEESRKGGAIIATAHEHAYSRTHLLSDMMNQIVVSRMWRHSISRISPVQS